jgi:hypothetical protein
MSSDPAHQTMNDEIRAKLLLPEDELLVEVGQSLGKGATFTDALKRGRQVVDNLRRELQTSVCSSAKVIACYKAAKSDDVALVAAIVDTIAGALHGIPPANIAVLLYRTDLTKYCGPNWPPEGPAH